MAAAGTARGSCAAADYVLWRDQFIDELVALSATSASNVPEPTSVSLLSVALILTHVRIRKPATDDGKRECVRISAH